MPKSTNPYDLTDKQKLFSELYTTKEFFGNGVQAYIEAYDPDKSKPNWYNTARSTSSEILTNPNVCNYINSLLDDQGLNDQFVDKQHLFLVTQHGDLKTKMAAIKEYNAVKQRVTKKTEVSVGGVDLSKFTTEELEAYEALITKANG